MAEQLQLRQCTRITRGIPTNATFSPCCGMLLAGEVPDAEVQLLLYTRCSPPELPLFRRHIQLNLTLWHPNDVKNLQRN